MSRSLGWGVAICSLLQLKTSVAARFVWQWVRLEEVLEARRLEARAWSGRAAGRSGSVALCPGSSGGQTTLRQSWVLLVVAGRMVGLVYCLQWWWW